MNKKSGIPFHYDTISIYNKGNRPNSIQDVIVRLWSPPMGLDHEVDPKLCGELKPTSFQHSL